jgi:hypothetical protein
MQNGVGHCQNAVRVRGVKASLSELDFGQNNGCGLKVKSSRFFSGAWPSNDFWHMQASQPSLFGSVTHYLTSNLTTETLYILTTQYISCLRKSHYLTTKKHQSHYLWNFRWRGLQSILTLIADGSLQQHAICTLIGVPFTQTIRITGIHLITENRILLVATKECTQSHVAQ